MNIDSAVERFREYLQHERGLSPQTVAAYSADLSRFADFVCERLGDEALVREVSPGEVRSFLAAEG